MITFAGENKEKTQVILEKPSVPVKVGTINLTPIWHGIQRDDRMWLWFPLTMEAEWKGKTLAFEWLKVYPRVIQWTDGKYYSFKGTHAADPEYGIKGDNTVFYREILVEQGEKIEYYSV